MPHHGRHHDADSSQPYVVYSTLAGEVGERHSLRAVDFAGALCYNAVYFPGFHAAARRKQARV